MAENRRRAQVWVIFCHYLEGDDRIQVRTVVDIIVRPACSSHKELLEVRAELERDYTAVNLPFFAVMTMHSPIVQAVMYPRVSSEAGRRQFKEHIRESCMGTYMDVDFDRLFEQVDRSLDAFERSPDSSDK